MIETYNFKLIKSGKEIEVYQYKNKKILRGYKQKKRYKKRKEKISPTEWAELVELWGDETEKAKLRQEQAYKTQFSISRTRSNIRRIVNANPQLNQFLTLTFAQSMPDLLEANKQFDRAMKRIIRAHPYFQYIAVNEFQKDVDYYGRKKERGGSVHYHLLCNLGPKDTSKAKMFEWERKFAEKYWKNGFVKIKPVSQVTNLGAYFCKYLGKDMFDKRMFRKKKYFCSRTLNRPVEATGDEAQRFFNRHVQSIQPIFEKTFSGEFTGKVDYKAYTLNLPLGNGLLTQPAGQYDIPGRV
jgi:hypothetical protein